MRELSPKQEKVYEWLRKYNIENRQSPTFEEIGKAFGIKSLNGVSQHLKALREKGFITWKRHTPRSIRLIKETVYEKGIPIFGRTPAGGLLEAVQGNTGALDLNEYYPEKNVYALQVLGDSMIGAGIFDGDYVIIKHSSRVSSGSIGIVEINNEATVKYIHLQKDGVVLEPANPAYEKMYYGAKEYEIKIDGPVVGLFRVLNDGRLIKGKSYGDPAKL